MSGGWKNIQVRHQDGRTGVIKIDSPGFCHRGLFIECDDGSKGYVQLNSNGKDSGDVGWEWLCAGTGGDPSFRSRWAFLGDHNELVEAPRISER